jgi:hypothetical protein
MIATYLITTSPVTSLAPNSGWKTNKYTQYKEKNRLNRGKQKEKWEPSGLQKAPHLQNYMIDHSDNSKQDEISEIFFLLREPLIIFKRIFRG